MGKSIHGPPRRSQEDIHGEETPPGSRGPEFRSQRATLFGRKVGPQETSGEKEEKRTKTQRKSIEEEEGHYRNLNVIL